MSTGPSKPILCPACKKPVTVEAEDFPFCSERCRLLDLGAWASGSYRVSSPALDPDLLEEVEEAELRAERRREGKL
jgi:endogenous inhibitor of DNA gyrase (YacG/DUF329 family)